MMEVGQDSFEEAARIVEAFAEGESEDQVLEMLADLAQAIRDRALND
jgi:hypothetical protein